MELSALLVFGMFLATWILLLIFHISVRSELVYIQKKIDIESKSMFEAFHLFADRIDKITSVVKELENDDFDRRMKLNDIKKDTSILMTKMEQVFEEFERVNTEITIHCNKGTLTASQKD